MKNESQIDRLFEQGISNLSHAPKTPMTDARIAAAASASKSGMVIWLLSHLKGIVICVVSFAVGVGVTLLATHKSGNRDLSNQTNGNEAIVVSDTIVTQVEKNNITNYPLISEKSEDETPISKYSEEYSEDKKSATTSNNLKVASSKEKSTAEEPVVVKKVIEQRDTIHIKEVITIKDTVYVP